MAELSDKLLISIVTPSYNQGQYIEETILSVKNQDYPRVEHIIIDGGSTDNTLEILKKYEGSYSMSWISEVDEGQSNAINKGIARAKGEIIGWLNSDDVYLFRSIISKVVKIFQQDKNADIVFGDLAYINKEGKILRFYVFQEFNYEKLLRYRYNLGQPAVFFNANILKENKIKENLHYVMDYELWLRLGKKYNFKHLSEVVAGFRVYAESKSGVESGGKFLEEKQKVLLDYKSREEDRFTIRMLDKVFRGGNARLKGLARLLKYKYIKKTKLAFNGGYLKFPYDIKRQVLSKI